MFQYEFMINAFAAAGIVAAVSGMVGFFLVMRGQTFAGHALSHIGFAGATGAGLIGIAPIWGLLGFTLAAGVGMGMLGERISNRDVAIGVVLALALGFGLLFLHYYTSFATQATAILFGNVLAVDRPTIAVLTGLAVVTLAALAAVEEVVTAPVLSRLYGTEIDVVHADGHIFVMSRGHNVERAVHLHEEDHAHSHQHDPGHVSI
ncbi:MAG: metal ABC transporter permease [Alphaproteobacteria bacterium]|nr:MAG: metal ABC transporter permease [Alphaproteobacteria bacterium]